MLYNKSLYLQCCVVQKNLRLPVLGSEFDVKAQWTKCMTDWCPHMPWAGPVQQISVTYSPLQGQTTKEIVLKVQQRLLLTYVIKVKVKRLL